MKNHLTHAIVTCLLLGAVAMTATLSWSCSGRRSTPDAPLPPSGPSEAAPAAFLYDFERPPRRYILEAEESLLPAEGEGRVDADWPQEGQHAYRIDFSFPRTSAGLFLHHVAVRPAHLPPDPWGLELWCRMDAAHPIIIEFLIEERSGELWTLGAEPRRDAQAGSWHRVTLPFDWAKMLSWTRDNGRFDPNALRTIKPFIKSREHGREVKGTIWLDGIRIIDAQRAVSAQTQGDFTLLNLSQAFDSDSFAWKSNPTDGDFHTGDWEPRTIPAEAMPQAAQAEFHGIPFLMPPLEDGRANTIRCNAQRLTGFPVESYSALYVLCTGKFGDHFSDVSLQYTDGTSARAAFIISDASRRARFGEAVAIRLPYVYYEHRIDEREPEIFIQSIRIDPARTLEAITLPDNDFIKVFAATLASSDSPPSVGAMHGAPLAEVDSRFFMPGDLDLDFSSPARSVGALGGYVQRRPASYRLEIPGYNGFLTFSANAELIPQMPLVFDKALNREQAFSLGGLYTDGYMATVLDARLLDSTCIEYSSEIQSRRDGRFHFNVKLSRAWPAALYETTAPRFYWHDPAEGGQTRVTMARGHGFESILIKPGDELPIPDEPWLLVWHTDDSGQRPFDAPMLLALEKRPAAITIGQSTKQGGLQLWFQHDSGLVRLAAMPLFGIRRLSMADTQQWADDSISNGVIEHIRLWVGRLQNFPIGLRQDFQINEPNKQIDITDRFDWIRLAPEWEFAPRAFTPLPPVAMLARRHDYPVAVDEAAFYSGVDAYGGPLWGVEMAESRYAIPLLPYSEFTLVPSRLEQHPLSESIQSEISRLIHDIVPSHITPRSLRSDTCHDLAQIRILGPSPLLMNHEDEDALRAYARAIVENALDDTNLKLEKEPLTGQYYLMDDRFWAKDTNYDKEWANGFMLQGLWHYGWYFNDFAALRAHWNKILGLYRYYQIVFDWANSTTWTLATGAGANSDGTRIAWEGMVCMARMAKAVGDDEIYADARIRASLQMMSLYASWFAPQWAVEQDYVTRHNRRIPADRAETRFSPDVLWAENYICNVCNSRDFFQVTHAYYIYNLAQMLFLHDYRLDVTKLKPWLMDVVPELHPQWADGNAICEATQQYYGNNAAMAHLIVRSLLLHQNLEEVYGYYEQSVRDTEVTKQWYSPMGHAPFALASMQTGAGPLAIVPIHGWRVVENLWRVQDKHRRIELTSTAAGSATLRLWCWDQPPARVAVNGAEIEAEWDAAPRYALIPISAVASGERCVIEAWFP